MSKRISRHGLQALCLAAVLGTAAGVTWAQESRGTLSGRVTDATGGVLPGTTVTVVNAGTNSTTRWSLARTVSTRRSI